MGGRIPTVTISSVLLPLSLALCTAACASIRPDRSGSLHATPAGPAPGNWEEVERLRAGSALAVTLKTGQRLGGALGGLTLDALTLADRTGQTFTVPRAEIRRIAVKVKDDLVNGALIGAGVGLGAALAVLAITGSQDGYVLPSAKWGAPLLLSGIGALGGMLVDRAHKRDKTVYVAP